MTPSPARRGAFRKSPLNSHRLRFVSSQRSQVTTQKDISPHFGFYKKFGRPIARVLLMATLTYQLSYWLWAKLEKDEIRLERQAEISSLETKLENVVKATEL